MAKNHSSWELLQHDPLEKLEDNLWRAEGEIPRMSLRRVMTIAKMQDDGLVIHNAICLDDKSMAQIESWGTPRYIVVPNAFHRLDAAPFASRYPKAKIVCPAAATKKVTEVVKVDMDYEDFADDNSVALRHIRGTADREGVMTVRHPKGATLVFNDLVFNMPHYKGFSGFVMRHLTGSTGGPRISRISKMMVVKSKNEVADDLRSLAEADNLSRIIVSHHQMMTENVAATLREVARTLG